jgi:hypothetical protein
MYILYKMMWCGITVPRKSLPLTLEAEKVKHPIWSNTPIPASEAKCR